jgi:tetratricopeptide (TPR) repeat protein
MTPWHRNEYILKGVFLGLWVFFALQVPADSSAAWIDIEWVLGWVCSGLLLGLLLGTLLQLSRGLRPGDNWFAFPLMVLLESPTLIYGGIMLGLAGGVLSGREFAQPWAGPIAASFGLTFEDIKHNPPVGNWLSYCVTAGVILGFALYRMRQVEDRTWRFWIGLGVSALMVYLASEYIPRVPGLDNADARYNLGVYILLGVPFFYLLMFCGDAEEYEGDVMTLCAALGVGLALIGFANKFPGLGATAAYFIPLTLYFVYGTRIMPSLAVFKHVLRGFSYMNLGRLRIALQFFRRALELDPGGTLATEGMITLHNNLTLARLEKDPGLVDSLDFSLCLNRAASLLATVPTPTQRQEADRFLELVEQMQPDYLARIDYLRVLSYLHARQYDAAADTLSRLLDPETPGYHPAVRRGVLYDAWDYALNARLCPPLVHKLGWGELNKPGRRMEAIAAVERKLAAEPHDPTAKEYRTMLYSKLSEAEFVGAISPSGQTPREFAYEYVEQLGLALVDNADPERRDRGMDFLRIAGRGMPTRGPGIYMKLAQVYQKQQDPDNMRKSLEMVKQVGQGVGPANLDRDQLQPYLEALRKLAELAELAGHYVAAIDDLRQYLHDGGTAAIETYRKLAELHTKTDEPKKMLNAVQMVETGLTYNSTDPDLLRKKDSYYYSLEPEELEKVKDRVVKWFDVGYCVRKAMSVLNSKEGGIELLDWASHLTRLALVMQPASHGVRLIQARVLLRRGERDAGLQLLEDIHYDKEKGSGDEEDAWYTATKLLGQLYLDELNKPELAMNCFLAFKDYHKSGADTLYQIARCYEATGQQANAIKFYTAVTGYEGHPLFWDAKDALRRLGKE